VKLIKGSKAQGMLAGLGAIVISLVIVTIILGILPIILVEMQTTQLDQSATTGTNETWTWTANNTLQPFVQGRVNTASVIVWCNITQLTVNTNYTVSSEGVTVVNYSADGEPAFVENCNYNMSYNYNYGSDARNISGTGLTANLTLARFIPTIAIVAIAAIIIGIILIMFGRNIPKKE